MTYSPVYTFILFIPLLFISTCAVPDVSTQQNFDYQTPDSLTWADPPVDSLDNYDFRSSNILVDEKDFKIIAHADRSFDISPKALLEKLRAQQKKVSSFTNTKNTLSKTEVHLYHRAEDKGLLTDNTSQSSINFSENTLHLVLNQLYPYGFSEKENKLYLRTLLGTPATEFLERGLAVYFCKNWQRLGYVKIAEKVLNAEGKMSLENLFSYYHSEQVSPIIKTALAGYFVNFLLETTDKHNFLEVYSKWKPDETTLQSLENTWQLKIADIENNRVNANAKKHPTLPYLKGFNFAHEGYNIYNGYGSKMAQQSLQRIASLSANAVAIIPYTFMRDPKVAAPIPISRRRGQENDEASVRTHFDAQQLGLKTLLKPQIWLRKSWPGEIEMDSPQKWDTFFRYYTNWISHYALLAEIHQFDILCIGVEMTEAALQEPDRWRKLIRKIRAIYNGPITYGSNWGKEFETLTFWDDLDYMAVSCYYPLTNKKNISEQELKTSFGDILKNIKKVQQENQRPLLFTEIGFRNITHPWTLPHARSDGRPENPAHQEIAYRIVLESLQEAEFISGLFWWKYPANLDYQNQNAFTPLRLPAEATLERFFREGIR